MSLRSWRRRRRPIRRRWRLTTGLAARLSGTRRRSARISGSGCAGRKTARGSPGELAGDTAQRTRRFELVREAFLATCRERQLVVIGGGEFQGLLVTAQGGVEMLQEHRLTLARCPGVSEAFKGNRAGPAEGRGPVVPAGVRDQAARHEGQICMTATSRPSTEFRRVRDGPGVSVPCPVCSVCGAAASIRRDRVRRHGRRALSALAG